MALLVDPVLKRRLETANNIMKNGTQGLVRAMGEALKQPADAGLRAQQRKVARELLDALDEIILVAQLSCKTMFDSLDLDFGIDAPKRPTIQELRTYLFLFFGKRNLTLSLEKVNAMNVYAMK